jgi:hypothetical protein
MKQVQLSDLVEIEYLKPLRSIGKRNTEEKVSEPFHVIKRQDINEFGYVRVTETTSLATLSERDLNYLLSGDRFLKPYDILIPFKHLSWNRTGIILDDFMPNCIAGYGNAVLRVEDQQLRKEISFNIFAYCSSKNGEQVFHDIRNRPPGRRDFLSHILIPLLEGDERKTLVNNVELQIQKCKEIEKIRIDIDRIREENGFIMSGNDEKPQYGA